MNTFTKIRKWAKENGFNVRDWDFIANHMDIDVNGVSFTISKRESTMYRSARSGSMKGNPKGMYLYRSGQGFAYQVSTQQEAIDEMKKYIQ